MSIEPGPNTLEEDLARELRYREANKRTRDAYAALIRESNSKIVDIQQRIRERNASKENPSNDNT